MNDRPAALLDASALVALADAGDASHEAAVAAYRGLLAAGYRLFATSLAVAESYDLLRAALGSGVARRWLDACDLSIYHPDAVDFARARQLLLAEPFPTGRAFVDAVNLATMERLGVVDAFAVDPHILDGFEEKGRAQGPRRDEIDA